MGMLSAIKQITTTVRNSLLILFLFTSVLFAQEDEQAINIKKFGELNTRDGIFALKLGDATIAHNINYNSNGKSISRRFGFDAVSTLASFDSVFALMAGYYSNGTQQLFFVGDSTDTKSNLDGYGSI